MNCVLATMVNYSWVGLANDASEAVHNNKPKGRAEIQMDYRKLKSSDTRSFFQKKQKTLRTTNAEKKVEILRKTHLMELMSFSSASSQWENQRKGLQNMLDSSINLGMMKEDKYVKKLLAEIWEHQKGAPIRPDTPSELMTSTREVISLLNDDDESKTTPLKQVPVSEEENNNENALTKGNNDAIRIVQSPSTVQRRYLSTQEQSCSYNDKKVRVSGRNLDRVFFLNRKNSSGDWREVPGNISKDVTPESLIRTNNIKNLRGLDTENCNEFITQPVNKKNDHSTRVSGSKISCDVGEDFGVPDNDMMFDDPNVEDASDGSYNNLADWVNPNIEKQIEDWFDESEDDDDSEEEINFIKVVSPHPLNFLANIASESVTLCKNKAGIIKMEKL